MKSPFPEMDPYLERHWQDVHQAICTYARDQMQEQLGSDLIARLNERLVVESMFAEPRTSYSNVRVVEQGIAGVEWSPSSASEAVAVAEPLVVQVGSDPMPQAFVEIMEADSQRLITVIEFLSPSNKLRGDGHDQYKQKQEELYAAKVSLVEIDLVRAGARSFILPEVQFPDRLTAEYYACVHRGWTLSRFELYPMSIRKKLPGIRVPLRRKESDIALDLQALIDQAYRNGRYDRTDYAKPCRPPLRGETAAWAKKLIKARKKK
ncbi:MAG TPA: DUF4058 family protein [Tepidisphaeraceae bacterium]|jgi:hypothetical protein|nr:DUF4058 family protein [Tepidisphaeraceae bacterium]